jgi:hypothetical protein
LQLRVAESHRDIAASNLHLEQLRQNIEANRTANELVRTGDSHA